MRSYLVSATSLAALLALDPMAAQATTYWTLSDIGCTSSATGCTMTFYALPGQATVGQTATLTVASGITLTGTDTFNVPATTTQYQRHPEGGQRFCAADQDGRQRPVYLHRPIRRKRRCRFDGVERRRGSDRHRDVANPRANLDPDLPGLHRCADSDRQRRRCRLCAGDIVGHSRGHHHQYRLRRLGRNRYGLQPERQRQRPRFQQWLHRAEQRRHGQPDRLRGGAYELGGLHLHIRADDHGRGVDHRLDVLLQRQQQRNQQFADRNHDADGYRRGARRNPSR